MKRKTEYSVKQLADAFRPVYDGFFYAAYAVTGNDRAAEKALIRAMLRFNGEISEKEVIRAALEVASENEFPVNFDASLGEDERAGALGEWISCQSDEFRRAVTLRFGIGLDVRGTAAAMGISGAKVRKMLETAVKSASRYSGRTNPEKALQKICETDRSEARLAPDYNTLIRALENRRASGEGETGKKRNLRSVFNGFTAVVALLVLTALIWICVLLAGYFRETYLTRQAEGSASLKTVTEDVHAGV